MTLSSAPPLGNSEAAQPRRIRPSAPFDPDKVPPELRALDQWVCWRYVVRGGKRTKVPFQARTGPRGGRPEAKSNDPSTWATFPEAVAAYRDPANKLDGVGFVFSAGDPFIGIDFDACLDEHGQVMEWARPWLARLAGSYAEVSPSGRGIKVFVRGKLPIDTGKNQKGFGPDGTGGVEAYPKLRFFTVTGDTLDAEHAAIGETEADPAELAAMHREWFPDPAAAPIVDPTPMASPSPLTFTAVGPFDGAVPNAGRPGGETRAIAYLEKMDPAVSGQNGSGQTLKAAVYMGPGFNLPPDVAYRILAEHFNPRCQPPWSEKDLRRKVAEAFKVETRRGFLLDVDPPANPTPTIGPRPGPGFGGSVGSVGDPSRVHADNGGGSVGSVGASPQDGPPNFDVAPMDLKGNLRPVEALDASMLPAALAPWLVDIARRGCFPLEYPAASALVALSSLVGRNVMIRPKRNDHWTVVPNLWGCIVGPPGMQKTPAVNETFLPIKRMVAEAIKAHEDAVKKFKAAQLIREMQADEARKKLKKGIGTLPDALRDQYAAEALDDGSETPEPTPRRYLLNDATIEKLGELLGENPRGVLQFRDELGGFLRSMDRQGHENDRPFYLECWEGNGEYTFDRIGRGTKRIPALCLSVFGTIQPGPLARYVKGSTGGQDADGFMPRFQLLVYPDSAIRFVNIDQYPDRDAQDRAYEAFNWIDRIDPTATPGVEHDEFRGIHYLRFDHEAQPVFDEWREELENRLRSGADGPLLTEHLSKYRSLMPSLALIFHLIDSAGSAQLPRVSRRAAEQAIAWCDFLEGHARRAYQFALDGDPELAQRLGDKIKAGSLPNPFTCRVAALKGWAGLDNVDAVRKAVGILEDRGWVKAVEKPSGAAGGRPSELVWINPRLSPTEPTKPNMREE